MVEYRLVFKIHLQIELLSSYKVYLIVSKGLRVFTEERSSGGLR